jgi:hypothetical protein
MEKLEFIILVMNNSSTLSLMKIIVLSLISSGDQSMVIIKPKMYLLLPMLMDRFSTGILILASVLTLFKFKVNLTHNYTV